MPITPSLAGDLIYQGAAHIIIDKPATKSNWKYIWVEGEVTVEVKREELDVSVAGWGRVGAPSTDETMEVTFTPSNRVDQATIDWLFGGLLSAAQGASYYGSSSTPLHVHTLAGRILTIANCRPTAWPSINFGVGVKRWGGAVTCTGILARGQARSASNALFTPWAAEEFTAVPDPDEYPQVPCKTTWGAVGSGATALEAMEAWSVTPQIELLPVRTGNLGTIDYRVGDVALEVSAVPANLGEAELWAAAAIGSRSLGTAPSFSSFAITEDYPGLSLSLPRVMMTQRPTRFDPRNPVAGECRWRTFRQPGQAVGAFSFAAAPSGT